MANLVVGSTVVIHPLGAFDPKAVLDAYEREGATVVFNVPQQWDLLCAQPDIDKRDLKLRIISWVHHRTTARPTRRGGLLPTDDLPRYVNEDSLNSSQESQAGLLPLDPA